MKIKTIIFDCSSQNNVGVLRFPQLLKQGRFVGIIAASSLTHRQSPHKHTVGFRECRHPHQTGAQTAKHRNEFGCCIFERRLLRRSEGGTYIFFDLQNWIGCENIWGAFTLWQTTMLEDSRKFPNKCSEEPPPPHRHPIRRSKKIGEPWYNCSPPICDHNWTCD